MKNSCLFSPNRQAMILSIGLHVLGLALLYFRHTPAASRISPGQSYTIALQPTAPYTPKKDDLSQNKPRYQMQVADTTGKKKSTFSKNRLKNSSIRSRRKYQKNKTNAQTVQKNLQSYKPPQIDKRGLYNTGKSGAKQAGATLELKGWEWNSVPRPNDSTEECGKIVFEIKVDKYGEIISIQTIEKTVTPMVEKIYADALRSLTFSKTAEQPSGISTGKVTFVLVAR